jgi:hypothetical protein
MLCYSMLSNLCMCMSSLLQNNTHAASGVVAVAAGGYHTCAETTGGDLMCWGWNNYGQLGIRSNTLEESQLTPQTVSLGSGASVWDEKGTSDSGGGGALTDEFLCDALPNFCLYYAYCMICHYTYYKINIIGRG